MEVGNIVRSLAGHDSDRFYVVVKTEEGFAWIADGKRRTLEKPKRKNVRHLQMTTQRALPQDLQTNKKIRHLLWTLNYGTPQPVTEMEEA